MQNAAAVASQKINRRVKARPKYMRLNNNAGLQMAIADFWFWHTEGLPDLAVQSHWFRNLLKKARTVGDDFTPPSQNSIPGNLLDKNYQFYNEQNKSILLKEAKVFGITWMGDGATIKRMALVNVLAMCADVPPIMISIKECTGHMSRDGKKDAVYISKMFESYVRENNVDKQLTDIIFFGDASNVQKARRILTAKYPRTMCCHIGEHGKDSRS